MYIDWITVRKDIVRTVALIVSLPDYPHPNGNEGHGNVGYGRTFFSKHGTIMTDAEGYGKGVQRGGMEWLIFAADRWIKK